jgi:hypothetical protein
MAMDLPQRVRMVQRGRAILIRAELDRTVVFGILAQAWGMVGGPVTVLLIANRFSPVLQGLHYTFYSLLGVQALVELGMNQVILQFASHEWSRLGLSQQGDVVGDPDALSRLASLYRLSARWYRYGSVLFGLALAVGGTVFFSQASTGPIHWLAPWLALCVVYSLLLTLIPMWAVLEGSGQMRHVYGFRLGQGVLGSLTTWTCIALGAGLWTAFAAGVCNLLAAKLFLGRYYSRFFRSLEDPPPGPSVRWRAEVFPLQWRVGLTYLCSYFMYMSFVPIVFMFRGPVAAGQMGMSWALISALSSVSMMFVVTKTPRFGVLIAQKRFRELDGLFWRGCVASVSIALLGSLLIVALVIFLKSNQFRFATRLLPLPDFALFLAATVLFQVGVAQSLYLRAHKREPLLGLSVANGIVSILLTLSLGKSYGPFGIAAGYLGVISLGTLPASSYIWARCRREWHARPAPR